MAKVITDKKLIKEVLTRGVENIYPSYEELEKKLLSGKRIRLYCGYDPSASSLHIGNAISLNKMAQFQSLGHEVIFLVGDFTGMIGDPTDKSAARSKLTRQEVLANSRDYRKQASAYLNFSGSNPAKLKYNSKWNDKLSFKDLIELSSHFTVQQMIQRDMFQERLKDEKPIYLHEFLYPLTQGYDSVAMNVDLEIGGNDQMFNMMCGRTLEKNILNKEKCVLTLKLLADETGTKMGKTEGNVVFLNEKPADMYGKIMSWPDGVMTSAFELCTNVPTEKLNKISDSLKSDKVNPRDLKMRLAFEITKINYGDKLAKEAQDNFVNTIQKKELPKTINTWTTDEMVYSIIDLLVATGLTVSKGEARRLINQKAIKVKYGKADFTVVTDVNQIIKLDQEVIVQRGKLHFIKVIK